MGHKMQAAAGWLYALRRLLAVGQVLVETGGKARVYSLQKTLFGKALQIVVVGQFGLSAPVPETGIHRCRDERLPKGPRFASASLDADTR